MMKMVIFLPVFINGKQAADGQITWNFQGLQKNISYHFWFHINQSFCRYEHKFQYMLQIPSLVLTLAKKVKITLYVTLDDFNSYYM